MKFYFATVAFALILAAVLGGAMLWDGSYYLYCALNSGHPCVSNNRWITLFLHFPVIALSHFIKDVGWLQLVFGLTYASVPLFVLGLSWWIVRDFARHLFVWAAFGLGFGTLLLQIHFVAEAIIAVQLAWPIFLAQLVPGRKTISFIVAILAILLLISHPFAIGFFVMMGIVSIFIASKISHRQERWVWALIWIILAVLALIRLVFASSAYEAARVSFSVFQEGFWSLRGIAGLAMIGVLLAASFVFLESRKKVLSRSPDTLKKGQVLGLFGATVLLLFWANAPQLWTSSFSFRVLAPLVSLPLFGFAFLEGFDTLAHPNTSIEHPLWKWRQRIIQTIGICFCLILCIQSWSWSRTQNQLLKFIQDHPSPCISLEEVSIALEEDQMPFHHWSITTLSLFLQGNTPQKIVTEQPCAQIDFTESIPVNGWEVQPWGTNRIFDFRLLEEMLRE
ncbi:MAG: hypothetical protein Fur0022_29150 [Anaerolineales bacterium]